MLALETSTGLGSVAIGDGARLLAECALSVRATHSETVLDQVGALLERAELGPGDLEAVVVGAGPGSFTGVRIAAALAKGICHAGDLPLYAFSSLRAVAAGVEDRPLCALFDARRGEVYAASFTDPSPAPAASGPAVGPLERVLDGLPTAGPWSFAGEGSLRHAARLEAWGGRVLPAHLGVPRAASLLWLARYGGEEPVADRATWEPEYVRRSGAERGVGARV